MITIARSLFVVAAAAAMQAADADTRFQPVPTMTPAPVQADPLQARAAVNQRALGPVDRPGVTSSAGATADGVPAKQATRRSDEYDFMVCSAKPVCDV